MLRELMGRDPARKALPALCLLAGVAWPFISSEPAGNPMIFGTLCYAFLILGRFFQRTTVFEAGLPIPGRQLVAARLLALAALVWVPALLMMGETLVLRGWRGAIPLLEMTASASLVVLVVQSNRIRQAELPAWPGYAAAVCVGVPLILRPQILAHWGAVLGGCVAGCAALLGWLWFAVPDSFQAAPAKGARAGRFAVRRPAWCRVWSPVWWPAWRSFVNWRDWGDVMWIVWPLTLGMSVVAGAWIVKPAVQSFRRIEWLLTLPISRRRLLLMMVLPWIGILLAFVSCLGHIGSSTADPAVSLGYSDVWREEKTAGSGTPNVLVPASFWRWAWGWKAPVIKSPWGEKTEPKTFIRLGLAYYNPYSVAPGNSDHFLKWQYARAMEAIYDRGVLATRRVRVRGVEALAATLFFLCMVPMALFDKANRRRGWRWGIWLGLILLFFCDFCTDKFVRESGPLSDIITLRLSAILPQNPVALVVLAALLLGGAYWAVERQFERLDLVPGPTREDGKG